MILDSIEKLFANNLGFKVSDEFKIKISNGSVVFQYLADRFEAVAGFGIQGYYDPIFGLDGPKLSKDKLGYDGLNGEKATELIKQKWGIEGVKIIAAIIAFGPIVTMKEIVQEVYKADGTRSNPEEFEHVLNAVLGRQKH